MSFNGDDMVREDGQTCSWEAHTGYTEDASLQKVPQYAAAVDILGLIDQPGYRWVTKYPGAELTNSIALWLLHDSTVKPLDRITVDGVTYRVIEVMPWTNTARQALLERPGGT